MPKPYVKKLAKKHHTSVDKSEKRWKKAKELAAQSGRPDDYAYITGIYKRMMGESKNKSLLVIRLIAEGALIINPEVIKSLRSNIFRYFSKLREKKSPIVTQDFSNILIKTLYSFNNISANPIRFPPEDIVKGFVTYLAKENDPNAAEFIIVKGEGYIKINLSPSIYDELADYRAITQFLEDNINRLVEIIGHEIIHAMQFYSVKLSADPNSHLFDIINRFSDGIPAEKRDKEKPWLFHGEVDKKEIMSAASQLAIESLRFKNSNGDTGSWKNSFYIRSLISGFINSDARPLCYSTIFNKSAYIKYLFNLPKDSSDKKRFLKYLYSYLDSYDNDPEVSGYQHKISDKTVFPSYGERSRFQKIYRIGNKIFSKRGK